jgi:hypothetical protein
MACGTLAGNQGIEERKTAGEDKQDHGRIAGGGSHLSCMFYAVPARAGSEEGKMSGLRYGMENAIAIRQERRGRRG